MSEHMAPDFRLVDSRCNVLEGRSAALAGMRQFIAIAPDFRINIHSMTVRPPQVLVTGETECSDERLVFDTLWHGLFDGRKIVQWQSFAPKDPPSVVSLLTRLMDEGVVPSQKEVA